MRSERYLWSIERRVLTSEVPHRARLTTVVRGNKMARPQRTRHQHTGRSELKDLEVDGQVLLRVAADGVYQAL
jgi:hypothetical protein